ncbi:MAG: Crp/Fnr family transcriptional regulator [Chloroflexota bacterium]|nr:Crp/Fnr family transcriptional regulator [Chloroflexota bacterium]
MLQQLPAEDRRRLLARGERVHLALRQVLFWPDESITHVYFPIDAVGSLLTLLGAGDTVEAGLVGHEGMVGLPVFLGADSTHGRAVCQVAGDAWRLPVAAFREESSRDGPLRSQLLRYTQSLLLQVSQSSGCNRAHPNDERCARWLLMTHDRVPGSTFHLTHEFLAVMLGIRRPSVTVVMGTLQQAGLLTYHRGTLTILDRAGLEGAACECYAITRTETERLLGPVFGKPGQ